MIWLILVIAVALSLGVVNQSLSEQHSQIFIKAALWVFVVIVSGLITRLVIGRLFVWSTTSFIGAPALAIPATAIVVLLIPIIFGLLILPFFVVIKKVGRK